MSEKHFPTMFVRRFSLFLCFVVAFPCCRPEFVKMCGKIVPFLMDWLVLFDYFELRLLFYKGLLSFNRVFGVLLTPGGFGNKVFQNISVE